MSNALAIAAVTAVLKDLLDNGLKAHNVADIVGGDVTVSALPPDRVNIGGSEDPTQLNVFLHQVRPNQGWSNIGYPSRNSNGERTGNPPLALNLHYLLTAYGAKDFYPEIILGHAMQLLHESPVLTRDAIRGALSPSSPPPDFPTALATSELADQVEQLRITPEAMNTEELSKLWSALQTHYRPTAAYQVTVVLIESNRSVKAALPVAGRNVYPVPFVKPVIDSVVSEDAEDAPITSTGTLLIKGKQLKGDATQVLIGETDMTSQVTELRATQITLDLDPLPSGIYAGTQLVQVIHSIEMGTPATARPASASNVAAFKLRPAVSVTLEPGSESSIVDDATVVSGEITVEFTPKVKSTQRVILFLNEFNPGSDSAKAYSFNAPAANGIEDPDTETSSITFEFANVEPGDYLVRAQVDGAENPLEMDGDGNYSSPIVTI